MTVVNVSLEINAIFFVSVELSGGGGLWGPETLNDQLSPVEGTESQVQTRQRQQSRGQGSYVQGETRA